MGHTVQRVIILVLTLGVIAFGVLVWSYGQYVRPGPLPAPITLVIPRGAGVDEIAARLSRTGVLADPLIFRHAARLTGHDKGLRAGEYAFAAAISAREVLMLLGSGKTVVRRLTVAEGLTTREVLDRLLVTEGLDGSVEPVPEEGSLLPETYHFSYGDSRAAMVHRMSTAMQETVTTLWWQRDMDLSLRSPRQMVVLASLVEKETGLAAERSRIAAVFLNRLEKGMRLQSDPTVVYGLTNGSGSLGRALTRRDLRHPSPYNTYVIKGLPPAPICNPGRASLESVVHPARTRDLYFVADGSGGHIFAATLKEHNQNVARWRRIRDAEGPSRADTGIP